MSTIYGQSIPTDIFKYRSLDGSDQRCWLRQVIIENTLYFSTPDQFNDPFDCYPVYRPLTGPRLKEKLPTIIRRHYGDRPRAERRAQEARIRRTPASEHKKRIEQARATMNESSIYSLSADPANLLMWSHYGSSHRGICLQFDMAILERHFVPQGLIGLPVKYSDERPLIVVGSDTEKPRELLQNMFLVKASAWSYEREWRFLDYRGGAGQRKFPSKALRGVILGARISDPDVDFVIGLAEERRTPLPIRRAAFDARAYQLNIGK